MCEYLTISQLFAQMKKDKIYIPLDKSINIKYIFVDESEINIEPNNRKLPIIVDGNALFKEVTYND